ncbi:MAG TPA: cyclic nucleotide-binding domain-containing protein [Thermoanaerobaculia bacterium]|nr:cyclic nucleotide-binding domain-containing protein [Thermoanaerobaculia bacterium]
MSSIAEMLSPYETVTSLPAGTVLFREGDEADGVYYLHSGEATLSFSSPRTRQARALLVASAGEILGVSCAVSGRKHDCSATTRSACVAGFVERDRFLRLLDEKPSLWLTVLRLISTNISACWDCIRTLHAH